MSTLEHLMELQSPLHLSHLRTFLCLAEGNTYTKAAELLNMTQPAVTQHIQSLEKHFLVALIERGRHAGPARLTPAGKFLAGRAAPLLRDVHGIDNAMRDFSTLRLGHLSIGASVTIGDYGCIGFLSAFSAHNPNITFDLTIKNTKNIVDAITSGSLEVGLVEGDFTSSQVDAYEYQDDELTLIISPRHRLARTRKKSLRAADIESEPFLYRESGSGTRALTEHAFQHVGITPIVRSSFSTSESIIRAVSANVGIALLSSLATQAAVDQGRVVRKQISDLPLWRKFRLITRTGRTLSPSAAAFCNIIRNERGCKR